MLKYLNTRSFSKMTDGKCMNDSVNEGTEHDFDWPNCPKVIPDSTENNGRSINSKNHLGKNMVFPKQHSIYSQVGEEIKLERDERADKNIEKNGPSIDIEKIFFGTNDIKPTLKIDAKEDIIDRLVLLRSDKRRKNSQFQISLKQREVSQIKSRRLSIMSKLSVQNKTDGTPDTSSIKLLPWQQNISITPELCTTSCNSDFENSDSQIKQRKQKTYEVLKPELFNSGLSNSKEMDTYNVQDRRTPERDTDAAAINKNNCNVMDMIDRGRQENDIKDPKSKNSRGNISSSKKNKKYKKRNQRFMIRISSGASCEFNDRPPQKCKEAKYKKNNQNSSTIRTKDAQTQTHCICYGPTEYTAKEKHLFNRTLVYNQHTILSILKMMEKRKKGINQDSIQNFNKGFHRKWVMKYITTKVISKVFEKFWRARILKNYQSSPNLNNSHSHDVHNSHKNFFQVYDEDNAV